MAHKQKHVYWINKSLNPLLLEKLWFFIMLFVVKIFSNYVWGLVCLFVPAACSLSDLHCQTGWWVLYNRMYHISYGPTVRIHCAQSGKLTAWYPQVQTLLCVPFHVFSEFFVYHTGCRGALKGQQRDILRHIDKGRHINHGSYWVWTGGTRD